MKNHLDRIVGPNGIWKDDGAADEARPAGKLNAREEFALRCLNAAANLYGVLTMDEFVRLYNGYAKNHDAPISDEMTVGELDGLVDKLLEMSERVDLKFEEILDQPEVWFTTWRVGTDVPRVIVFYNLTETDDEFDGTPLTPKERKSHLADKDRRITHRIAGIVAKMARVEPKILPEEEFLDYEEPMFAEEFDATVKLSKFIQQEYGLDEDSAELDIWGIQSHVRFNGPKVVKALEYIRDMCDWQPEDYEGFEKLVRMLGPVVDGTRTWEGRAHSQIELYRLGVLQKVEKEDVYDVFGLGEDDAADDEDDE